MEMSQHRVVVAARSQLAAPSRARLPAAEPAPGLVLPDGDINWGCPCLGGMATGPCGYQFRDAFSCFHYSEADPKGSDCYEKFSVMQQCMSQYPELYGKDEDDELAAAMSEPAAGDARDAAPGSRDAAPGSRDAAPGSRDAAPGSRDVAAGSRDAAPGASDAAPGSRDAAAAPFV